MHGPGFLHPDVDHRTHVQHDARSLLLPDGQSAHVGGRDRGQSRSVHARILLDFGIHHGLHSAGIENVQHCDSLVLAERLSVQLRGQLWRARPCPLRAWKACMALSMGVLLRIAVGDYSHNNSFNDTALQGGKAAGT
mmetsp:Transcript_23112/g.33554  ORF Transcript_23112/g.33554 Transcript_23112/m.33554 type:complete len:137 (+) Transcript_23112:303-713(+)